jgi:GT2 family glycosyltransferase
MNRDAGIVIITHNSADFLEPCLRAALSRSDRVVVVDNASRDNSADLARKHPGAQLIANSSNRGFAGAANQGIRALDRDFVLLLNPDAIIETPLDPLVEACSRFGVGAAGGKLVHVDGAPQRGFMVRRFPTPARLAFECLGWNRIWPSNPVNRRYRYWDFDCDRRQRVEQPAGAFLMVRRRVWEALGGFDEAFYPVWYEEVDFLQRAAAKGYSAVYVPQAIAVHHGGHSVSALPPAAARWYWYDNLLRFSAKHFHSMGFRVVSGAVLVGVLTRMAGGRLIGSEEAATGYGRVLRLAGRALIRGPAGLRCEGSAKSGDEQNDSYTHVETTTQANLTNSHSHGT